MPPKEAPQSFVFPLQVLDKTTLLLSGGKAANLGELSKIPDLHVPPGFCISTAAFKNIIGASPAITGLLDQLALLKVEDRDSINTLSAELRRAIEKAQISVTLSEEITRHLSILGTNNAYAIRSSATTEDLPTASFAGQQDTYLNCIGLDAILRHISKCWASVFTERAVIYRIQHGFEHHKVQLAVVVQQMVFPQASGIMFTADPVTGNRKVLSIDASFGLGEALVAGLVNADTYKVRNGELVDKKISNKKLGIYALKDGGTTAQELAPEQQHKPALSDEQILQLAHLGRKIEAHFGCPQDIEWCWANDVFYIVQSRPITTLFPIPQANDAENHVYLSVGHQQMMTDAIKPLGLSIRQLTAGPPMHKAGGRLFVDVTKMLRSEASRAVLLKNMEQHDPLIKDAMLSLLERGDFIRLEEPTNQHQQAPISTPATFENDPNIVSTLIQRTQNSLETLKQGIQTLSGSALFEFISADFQELKKILFDPQSFPVIRAAMDASFWINENMQAWLGEKNAADILTQSVPNNITSEMGLALLDVADAIRPYPELIDFLRGVKTDNFLDELPNLPGGQEAHAAITDFLNHYGMRCVGEIDISKTRWSEKPAALIPILLSNIKNFEPGASKRKFEQGLQEAKKKEQDLLTRLADLPDGSQKVAQTKEKIDLLRNFIGYREYPKYGMINRYFMYKQALLKEAERLVQAGLIAEKEEVYYLTFEEFHTLVCTHTLDATLIHQRKEEFRLHEKLTPPRVITSDGEIVTGTYKGENLPVDAMIGLAVSAGVVEGRARVMLNIEDAHLEAGDILVTPFTDPSWTPLFVAIKGLVTEVGGLMTHGAVIAREYGLPAVVGVENATKRIEDGQRIRVHGTEGYVEIL